MTCTERDADLLMLAHGELDPLSRRRTMAHIRRCDRCAARYAQLVRTSSMLAGAIRDPGMPQWKPRRNRFSLPHALSPTGLFVMLSLGVLFVVIGFLVMRTISVADTHAPAAQRSATTSDGGCLPNLPNDHCR